MAGDNSTLEALFRQVQQLEQDLTEMAEELARIGFALQAPIKESEPKVGPLFNNDGIQCLDGPNSPHAAVHKRLAAERAAEITRPRSPAHHTTRTAGAGPAEPTDHGWAPAPTRQTAPVDTPALDPLQASPAPHTSKEHPCQSFPDFVEERSKPVTVTHEHTDQYGIATRFYSDGSWEYNGVKSEGLDGPAFGEMRRVQSERDRLLAGNCHPGCHPQDN